MSPVLTVLGCSGMFATRDRAASGYLLESSGRHLWLDAGAGTWQKLLTHIDYSRLGGVLLTHRHPDHTTDVFQALHALYLGASEPLPAIPLWAPAETIERLRGFEPDLEDSFEVRALSTDEAIDFGGARLSFVSMVHPAETLGVRIEGDGRVLAYSADSGAGADFEALAGGADLFVCEATHQDSDEPWFGHLRASEAARIAERVGAGRLLLTHLPPGRDHQLSLQEARAVTVDVEVELASEGHRVEI